MGIHLLNLFFGVCLMFTGCVPAQQHASSVQEGLPDNKLTVGLVQGEIRQGMGGAEVAQVLGSPNIVSRDENGKVVWIYDKISTDTIYSSSSGGVSSLIIGSGGSFAGGVAANTKYGSGSSATSQRTLTVIIKFDDHDKVQGFSYHSSKF